MKTSIGILAAALVLTACGQTPLASNASASAETVQVSLPDEPPVPWTGADGAMIERHCVACHSPEMIANQPPLAAEKWQATIDKMRTVYHAPIPPSDDAALIAALVATRPAKP